MNPTFLDRLSTGKPILSDGAMGTLLHQRGVSFEASFDLLNLQRPALVADIHREYIDAGSQIIQTNTFGANRYKLAEHGLEEHVTEINNAAVELARRVVLASFQRYFYRRGYRPAGCAHGAVRPGATGASPRWHLPSKRLPWLAPGWICSSLKP